MKNTHKYGLPKKVLGWLLLATLALVTVHLVLQYVNLNLLNEKFGLFYELTNRFDLDDEVSVPTWVSQIMFLGLATTSAVAMKLSAKKGERHYWALLAVVALLGSIDEGSGLHELALQSVHNLFLTDQSATLLSNAWWIVMPFILLAAAGFLYKTSQLLKRRTVTLLALGLGVYLTGAVLIDLATNIQTSSLFLKQGVLVAIEEGLELIGLSILIYAATSYLSENHTKPLRAAWAALKHEHVRLEATNVKTKPTKNRP